MINYNADRKIVEKLCNERNFHNSIELHYVDNLNDAVMQYLHSMLYRSQFHGVDLSYYNAIALPYEGYGFHIIIDKNKAKPLTTVLHEATHIIDYYEFMIIFNDGNINITKNDLYPAFYFYSEFNARFTAHYFLLSTINVDSEKNFEIPELTNIINQIYDNKNGKETVEDFYELMQLFGRWFAIEIVMSGIYELPHYITLYEALLSVRKNTNKFSLQTLITEFESISIGWNKINGSI